jgi:hypothetical protein
MSPGSQALAKKLADFSHSPSPVVSRYENRASQRSRSGSGVHVSRIESSPRSTGNRRCRTRGASLRRWRPSSTNRPCGERARATPESALRRSSVEIRCDIGSLGAAIRSNSARKGSRRMSAAVR